MRECQRTSPNDLCGPCDPDVCDHGTYDAADPGVATVTYTVKLRQPLKYIPIMFDFLT